MEEKFCGKFECFLFYMRFICLEVRSIQSVANK